METVVLSLRPHPPTIPNVPAVEVNPDEVAEHVLSVELTESQQKDIHTLLQAYPDRLRQAATGSSTGRTNLVTHRIDTGDAPAIKARPHRQSQQAHQTIRENVQKLLAC